METSREPSDSKNRHCPRGKSLQLLRPWEGVLWLRGWSLLERRLGTIGQVFAGRVSYCCELPFMFDFRIRSARYLTSPSTSGYSDLDSVRSVRCEHNYTQLIASYWPELSPPQPT